ncbi:MAG: endonuclease III [Gemmatimonadota bacterium]|nr:endonuclease III [Gemmatimonadota bacterium]
MNSGDAKTRAKAVIRKLDKQYPDAECSLTFKNPFELLVATILSAQCTDARVNMVTKDLFKRYTSVKQYAEADLDELSEIIRSTGFFRNKAKNLIGMANALRERHGGRVPKTLAELAALPGVGRKTANVVLGNAFGIDEGVVVDTHVKRISNRLGFTKHQDPVKIEQDLIELIPQKRWTLFPHLMIQHGRAICQARKPKCEICPIHDLCPSGA